MVATHASGLPFFPVYIAVDPRIATTFERVAIATDVPTVAESGYPGYGVSVWYGVAAQSKLSDDVAARIRASLDKALNDDVFRASLEKIGFPPLRPKSATEIDQFIATDRGRWAGVIKALNISLD